MTKKLPPSRSLPFEPTRRPYEGDSLDGGHSAGVAPLVVVVGAGAWGTALALAAHRAGCRIVLVPHTQAQADQIRRIWVNEAHLPGVVLPTTWNVTLDYTALEGADCIVVATPAQTLGQVVEGLVPVLMASDSCISSKTSPVPLVLTSKGFQSSAEEDCLDEERGAFALLSDVVQRALLPFSKATEAFPTVVLSGPSFAVDVARDLPTAIVAASKLPRAVQIVQQFFSRPRFRVYSSDDIVGVQLGGALKNVIAIAAGIALGLDLGDNARAALITRGLAELTRLGFAMGGRADTFSGLAGLGDLVLTCSSPKSRNMSLGVLVAKEGSTVKALEKARYLSEGLLTARAAVTLARGYGVDVPICEAVYNVLRDVWTPAQAVEELLSRPLVTASMPSNPPSAEESPPTAAAGIADLSLQKEVSQ